MNISFFRQKAFLCVFAFIASGLSFAHADDVKDAIKIMEDLQENVIRKELQRRIDERLNNNRVRKTIARTRQGKKLLRFSEETLIKAARTLRKNGGIRGVYGLDDRMEWHEIRDENIRVLAKASVAMFHAKDIASNGSSVKFRTKSLGSKLKLCPDEKFVHQQSGPFCSATLVKPDMVLTAAHCLKEVTGKSSLSPVNKILFVFGYHVDKPGGVGRINIPSSNIFTGFKVQAGQFDRGRGQKKDWALVKLNRPVPSQIATPVMNWKKTPVRKEDEVFVIGYPSGLPLKYAPGAQVRNANFPAFFRANLDTFGGNSGSGVFDSKTNELVGVLVRGDTDYVRDKRRRCRIVNICPTTGCRGEDVMKISLIPQP